jgi:hypothetical protein
MKILIVFIFSLLVFWGCKKEPQIYKVEFMNLNSTYIVIDSALMRSPKTLYLYENMEVRLMSLGGFNNYDPNKGSHFVIKVDGVEKENRWEDVNTEYIYVVKP